MGQRMAAYCGVKIRRGARATFVSAQRAGIQMEAFDVDIGKAHPRKVGGLRVVGVVISPIGAVIQYAELACCKERQDKCPMISK